MSEQHESPPAPNAVLENPVGKFLREGGRVAQPGAFLRKLKSTTFSASRIIGGVANLIETGRFAEAVAITEQELKRRRISFEYGKSPRGTAIKDNQEIMILGPDYPSQHPVHKLHSLLHRNMSLILQRAGLREEDAYLRQLLEMDITYAETARLGANQLPAAERKKVLEGADIIEYSARIKLVPIDSRLHQ